ncbi:MAG: SDR family NAD(P)-dependent oxidoreductase [Spirochaetaceae bacterium]|nr:SDR family NAD(P)-dependent oxidoreductase [Spirochaetaceae bacterium]
MSDGDAGRSERREAERRTLQGQVAVVTGAAGAIGRAVAGLFAGAGARVVLGDRRGETLHALAAGLGTPAAAIECDVTQPEQVARLVAAARERWQRLDVLVNVAGITHFDDVLDVSVETWREVFAVNVEAVLTASQQAAALMTAQAVRPETGRRGTIVNIGSQGAEFPIPSSPAYGASKAALNYLSRTLADALEGQEISSTVVVPGMVYEGMWKEIVSRRAAADGQSLEEAAEAHLAETPTGRFQKPADLANIVLYVATSRGMALSGRIVWSEAHQEWR